MSKKVEIEVVRSDMGDGGWSLHPAGYSDADYAGGNVPLLASGGATMDEETGDWDRPNAADYAAAEEAREGAAPPGKHDFAEGEEK